MDSALDDLYDVVLPVMDAAFPMTTFKVRLDGPGVSLKRDTLWAMHLRDTLHVNDPNQKVFKHKASELLERDRTNSITNKLQLAENKQSASWAMAHVLMGSKKADGDRKPLLEGSTSDSSSANVLNRFYIEKAARLKLGADSKAATLVKEGKTRPPAAASPRHAGFPPLKLHSVGPATVRRHMKQLKNTSALGNDGIPVKVWKEACDELVMPVLGIVNASIQQCRVPSKLKEAVLQPILKKNKPAGMCASYRPVAILNSVSKVLEAVVHEQLYAALEERGVLLDCLHGYRKRRSTTTAITSFVSKMVILGKGAAAAFDFSAAFDTLSSAALEEKLRLLGADPTLVSWLGSYLEEGMQRVNWNGSLSDFLLNELGCRQGSILGPLLFVLLSLDVPTALGEEDTVTYADDNNTVAGGVADLQVKTDNMELAAADLGLSLNPEKTQLLYFGGYTSLTDLLVGGATITPSDTIDILGFTLDKAVSPKAYAEKLLHDVAGRLAVVRLLRHRLRQDQLRMVGYGLVMSKVRFCIASTFAVRLQDDDPKCDLASKLQVLVNDLARLFLGRRRADNQKDHLTTRTLLQRTELQGVNAMVAIEAAAVTWSALNGGPLRMEYNKWRPDSRSRSAADGELRVPPHAMVLMRSGVRLWNSFPELRGAKTKASASSIAKKLADALPI